MLDSTKEKEMFAFTHSALSVFVPMQCHVVHFIYLFLFFLFPDSVVLISMCRRCEYASLCNDNWADNHRSQLCCASLMS